jgi:hypothetical protein
MVRDNGGRAFPGALRCGASELTDQRHMFKTLGEHADSLRAADDPRSRGS